MRARQRRYTRGATEAHIHRLATGSRVPGSYIPPCRARPAVVAPRTGWSRLPAGPRIEPFEKGQPMLEDLMVVGIRGKKPADHEIDSAGLVARELAVSQISLMHDLGKAAQAAIPKPGPLEESLEDAVLPHVAELGPGRIEGNGLRREILGISEQESRLGIDESLDEPRRGQAVDLGPTARNPLSAPKLPKIRHLLSSLRLFRWSGAHGDGLPHSLDLGPRRGVEEIELVELLVLPLELGQLSLDSLAGSRRLFVEVLQQLPIPAREPAKLGLTRLVKETDHVLRAHILDLLDAEERGLSPLPLDLLGEPLEMLVVVGGIGQ